MMKSFQIFWVLFKSLLEIIWCIIKMMYTVKYLNVFTLVITVIAIGTIVFKIIKRRVR